MNTTKPSIFTRFVAAPIAAAGILGGVALGVASAANADPGPSDHSTGSYSSDFSRDSRDSDWDSRRGDFWNYFWFSHHHRDHDFRSHRDS